MSAHISDELPRMLTGEASRDAVLAAADHLRTCVDCQHELVSATVAHASLTSAQRFAPEIISGTFTGNYFVDDAADTSIDAAAAATGPATADVTPISQHVERQHLDTPHAGTHNAGSQRGADSLANGNSYVLPDLSSVFARVRSEAAAPPQRERSFARPARSRLLIGAAAAVVVLGGGGAIYAATSGDTSQHIPAPTAGRPVQLSAYDVGRTSATATLADSGTVSINAASLPKVSGKLYEVWLTNDARTRMQPVGWLGANGKAALAVPKNLLAQYQDLEISVQKAQSNDYAYSNVSVLRGSIE